mgnify:FL=1
MDKWQYAHEYGNGLSNILKSENDNGHFTKDKGNTCVMWSFYSIIIINDNDIFEFHAIEITTTWLINNQPKRSTLFSLFIIVLAFHF